MHNRKGMLNFATLLISQISNIYNTMLQEITITLSVWQHLLLMTYVAFNIVILAFYVDNLFQEKLLYKYLSIVFILYFGLIFYLLVKLWELCEWVVVKTYIHYWFQIWFTSEFNDMKRLILFAMPFLMWLGKRRFSIILNSITERIMPIRLRSIFLPKCL